MSEFYAELKALRKQQGINLEEIHSHAKEIYFGLGSIELIDEILLIAKKTLKEKKIFLY